MTGQIGYIDASCGICGESYNGYKSHSCPPTLAEADAALAVAAHE